MPRILRENAQPTDEGWSSWEKAIVPDQPLDDDCETRGHDQKGLMWKEIRNVLPDVMRRCGIYEWQARGTFVGQPDEVVVYVGSTCRRKQGALRGRILEYCVNGSHKSAIINTALERGYELWVRVKTSDAGTRIDAENMENELLEKYDYAWNFRNNGRTIRHILTAP